MLPTVSIIIPCYNEERRIQSMLDAIFSQTYPLQLLDVTLADGHSTDGTRRVIETFAAAHPQLRLQVVENDARSIPAALNRAIAASRGEIILRLDGHSQPSPDYVEKSVAALLAGKGENVGGVWEIRPGDESRLAAAIARAAAHPLAVGDALYRHTKQAAVVDTVPFGAFRRSLVEKIGGFDESLLSNEDYEFNARIRQSGGKIWLDPQIRSVYFARATLTALAQQYWRYGFWKWQMLRRYPATLRWRQALPPIFTLSLLINFLLTIFFPLFGLLLALEIALYLTVLTAAGARAGEPFLALPVTVMHLSWGGGFLWSLLAGRKHA
ncbi:MAG: glycosyltransferase family 2 protein [Anaerolineales bacterium]